MSADTPCFSRYLDLYLSWTKSAPVESSDSQARPQSDAKEGDVTTSERRPTTCCEQAETASAS
jgi:hypothetical protein